MPPTIQFDPTSLSKYGHLSLVARNLVEGFLTGAHKSPYKGFSVEGYYEYEKGAVNLQGGNPLNVVTTSTYNGVAGTIRPTLLSNQFHTGRRGILANGNVSYIQGTVCTSPTTPG